MGSPVIDVVKIFRPGQEVDAERLFAEACRRNRFGKVEQEANGDVLIMPPTGLESSVQNLKIDFQLNGWAERDGRGADDAVEILENPKRVIAGPPVTGFVLKMAAIWKGLDS